MSKGDLRLEAYGTVDEFNSALGLAISLFAAETRDMPLAASSSVGGPSAQGALAKVEAWAKDSQSRLFDLGSQLACDDEDLRRTLPLLLDDNVTELERQIDQLSEALAPLRNFILPGGAPSAAAMHIARTICRRAERVCVRLSEETAVDPVVIRYLNRASDWCFVLARFMNATLDVSDEIWSPRR